jgi:phosphatidylglycerophosphate synthase
VDILMRDRRRGNATIGVALGASATAAAAWTAGPLIGGGTAYAAASAGIFVLLMGGTAIVTPPSRALGAADSVTAFRAMLVALMAGSIGRPYDTPLVWAAIVISTIVALLDGVDGWLARRDGTPTPFGARFDMETDALLILVLSILVWQQEKAGAWVLLCGLMRYAFVLGGRVLPWLARPLRSTRRGKTIAVLQVVGLNIALGPIIPVPLSTIVAAGTLALLAWSFAVDITWLARHAPRAIRP